MRSCFVFAALSPLSILAAGLPSCLLAAIAQQGMPSGVEAICDKSQKEVVSNLVSMCNFDHLQPAYDAFASTCAQLGIDVVDLPPPSSSLSSSSSPSPLPSPSSSSAPLPSATLSGSVSYVPSSAIPTPSESKPGSAAGVIAPHAVILAIFGLSTTGLFNIIFL